MFFRSTFTRLPSSATAIHQINAMGGASKIWFTIPAVLVLIGLRHQFPIAVLAVTLALVAVGITMYDAGPLNIHLAAVFIAAVVLATVMSVLVIRHLLPADHLEQSHDPPSRIERTQFSRYGCRGAQSGGKPSLQPVHHSDPTGHPQHADDHDEPSGQFQIDGCDDHETVEQRDQREPDVIDEKHCPAG